MKFRIRPGSRYSGEFIQPIDCPFPFDDGVVVEMIPSVALDLLREVYDSYANNTRSDVILSSEWKRWREKTAKEMGWE